MINLPERDPAKSNAEQGVYRKFDVRRTDGSDGPGGKHEGCEYFVLDVNHDPHALAALAAYAKACEVTHPQLAADLRDRYSLYEPAPSVEIQRARVIAEAAQQFADDRTHLGNLVYVNDLAWALKVLAAV